MTINLDKVIALLDEADKLVDSLDGEDLDERIGNDRGSAREARVRKSRELQLLAHQLELAAQLVRHEYWHARGGSDAIYNRSKP